MKQTSPEIPQKGDATTMWRLRRRALAVGATSVIGSQLSNHYHWRYYILAHAQPPFDVFQHTNNVFDTGFFAGGLALCMSTVSRSPRAIAATCLVAGVALNAVGESSLSKYAIGHSDGLIVSAVPDIYDFEYGALTALGVGALLQASGRRRSSEETCDVVGMSLAEAGPAGLGMVLTPEHYESLLVDIAPMTAEY